eukprot:scaffold776_cov347-Pavlova_lutheri.AAC.60
MRCPFSRSGRLGGHGSIPSFGCLWFHRLSLGSNPRLGCLHRGNGPLPGTRVSILPHPDPKRVVWGRVPGGEGPSQCRSITFIPFGSGSIPGLFPVQTRWGSGLDRWVSPGSIRFRRGRGKKGDQPPARVVEHISWSRAREKRRCSRHRSTSANADAEGDANERK